MKSFLIALLLAAPLCAQTTSKVRFVQPPTSPPLICASTAVSFSVKKDDTQHALPQSEPDKAQIVFIHDSGGSPGVGYPTTKIAMDGAWVGANHDDTWFAVSVAPGEHHVCVALQSSVVDYRVEMAHLNAQPGGVYYFRTRLVLSRQVELLELEPADSDEGNYLVHTFPMSISKPKK
jgi:hypothetical protein